MTKEILKAIGGAALAMLMSATFVQVWATPLNNVSVSPRSQGQNSTAGVMPAAFQPQSITITTQKPFGPVPGTFVTSGAFADSGILVTESRIVSAIPSTFGVVTHLLVRFDGQQGTFWIRTQIRETTTDDEQVFANNGVWVIVDGTGAYSTLHGTGDMEGTADDAANLITRIYNGLVHF